MVYREQSRMKKNNHCIRYKDHLKLLVWSSIIVIFIALTLAQELLTGDIVYRILNDNEIFLHVSSAFLKFLKLVVDWSTNL